MEEEEPDEALAVEGAFTVVAVALLSVAFAVWLDFAGAGSSLFFLLPVSFMATSPFWFIAVTLEAEAEPEFVLYETDVGEDEDGELLTVSLAYTLAVSAMTVTLSVLISVPVVELGL